MGISNFPALLQDSLTATLESLHLGNYEISPTEPLHDLKGHLTNIIEESLTITSGSMHEVITAVKRTVLWKDTIQCSDLRKAVIYNIIKLNDINPNAPSTQLYRSAVEISYLFYTHDSVRTPKTILCLHNRAFLHAHQCTVLFSSPQTVTRRKMFGRYFHSIACHAALMFRIVSLRSLNTEQHERIFQQAKGILRDTTNHHVEHVIPNIIQRLQLEVSSSSIKDQESEIYQL